MQVYQLKTFIPDHQVVFLDKLLTVSVTAKPAFMAEECGGGGKKWIFKVGQILHSLYDCVFRN